MDFKAIAEAAALTAPMTGAVGRILQGRILYLDGDGLAYYCAGNDETLLSEARGRVATKVDMMRDGASAEKVVILLTGSGSHKGHRYAIARAKSYQGGRANSRRPNNWLGLRAMLEEGRFGDQTIIDYDREADDRFGQFGHADPEHTVIGTQDKDMRMLPGYHLNWTTNRLYYVPPGTYSVVYDDKQFGTKWFWLQMLHGDPVDGIPGLPKAYGKLCGPVAAEKILAMATNDLEAFVAVGQAYHSHYAERWHVEMMEQACLLWMRRCPDADWFDVAATGGPMGVKHTPELEALHYKSWQELSARVKEAEEINALQTQSE